MFHRIPSSQALFISPIRRHYIKSIPVIMSQFLSSFFPSSRNNTNFSAPNYTRNHIIEHRKGLSMLWRKKGTSLITIIDGHFLFNRSYTVCISGWRKRRSIGWVHSLINFKVLLFRFIFCLFLSVCRYAWHIFLLFMCTTEAKHGTIRLKRDVMRIKVRFLTLYMA